MHFLRLPFTIVACVLLVLAVCRLLLLVTYPDYFSVLSFSELMMAFMQGVRFDLSVAVISQSLILLLLLIPSRWIHNRKVLPLLSAVSLLIALAVVAITLADISYFSEVKRHMGAEIGRLQDDYAAVLEIALTSRLTETLSGLLLLFFVAVFWYQVVIKPVLERDVVLSDRYWRRGLAVVMGFMSLLLMGRGLVLQSKPLDIVDAFSQGSQVQANLTLNGAFVAFKENRSSKKGSLQYLSDAEFTEFSEKYFNDQPFTIQTEKRFDRKNVVFVLLESWSYKYIDGLAGNNYNVTPFMDRLIKQSLVWDHFYAAGQRSILGIQAVLSSVPVLPTQPVLGWGLELHNMSRLAVEAEREGFRTLMVQSSNRRSFHMDGIARSLGFAEYYGKEDMPLLRDYPQDVPRFGWDYETLMFMKSRIDQGYSADQPFFSFAFTGTTHEPFADPGPEFHIYPHSDDAEEGFLNTIRYADWSLEQFMRAASESPWYKDTVFVFTADHVLKADTTDLKQLFHIPLVIYTPDGSIQAERRQQVASQYDLLPSLLELMGIETTVSSFGRSLWGETSTQGAYVSQGSVAGYILFDKDIPFTEEKILSKEPLTGKEKLLVKNLQWRLQAADRSLKDNRWVHLDRALKVVSD